MNWVEAFGYLASSLVLVTFCMHTMLALRALAICSNIAFLVYGIAARIYPVLILHLILLPLNVAHLTRMILVLRRAKLAADTDLSPNWLLPYMQPRRVRKGETLFKKGDYADALYLIASGGGGICQKFNLFYDRQRCSGKSGYFPLIGKGRKRPGR